MASSSNDKWSRSLHRLYKPERLQPPVSYRELSIFLGYVETHHRRCPVEGYPASCHDLQEPRERGHQELSWVWTSFCEGAFRKVEHHFWMHQVFDYWPQRAFKVYRDQWMPNSLADLKAWLAQVHDEKITGDMPG